MNYLSRTMINQMIISFLVFLSIACGNLQNDELTHYVFDQENIMTDSQEQEFNNLFMKHEEETSNQIALFTTKNFGEHEDILLYSMDIAHKYGIGQKDLNNGVLIVFSKNLRQIQISTGYGLENILKDEIVKIMIDSLMLPEFKEGHYNKGLLLGSEAIIEFLEKPENRIN